MRALLGYWWAIGERYRAEAAARAGSQSTGRVSVAATQARPPIETVRNPDGSTSTTYNMWSYARTAGKGQTKLR